MSPQALYGCGQFDDVIDIILISVAGCPLEEVSVRRPIEYQTGQSNLSLRVGVLKGSLHRQPCGIDDNAKPQASKLAFLEVNSVAGDGDWDLKSPGHTGWDIPFVLALDDSFCFATPTPIITDLDGGVCGS